MENIRNSNTKNMALAGLFAALTAVGSWISIPLGFTPVPMNLATLAVFLTGGLLGAKNGTRSIVVYALVGAVGVPVFAGFRGGLSVLAGPTGGYIIGYILAAFLVGILVKNDSGIIRIAASMIAGLAACYALGTAWFIISTHTGFAAAMMACVVPFLPGDAIKIAAGTILVRRLRKYI